MNFLIDKLIIFIVCLNIFMYNSSNIYDITIVLVSITLSSINGYKESEKFSICIFISFLLLCFYKYSFLVFIPLLSYDLFFYKIKYLSCIFIIPILVSSLDNVLKCLIVSITVFSYVIYCRTKSYEYIKKEYYTMRDLARELSFKFEKRSRELLENQDYEINLATLQERNRIARDIHDNVGHLLSRCILQIGAIIIINKNKDLNASLSLVKDTLNEAMDSIRNSVHDLHEDSIDLHVEIQKLVDNFEFCTVNLTYNIESSLEKNIKNAFISIIKESFSNIIKHSNATKVDVYVNEFPGFYQLIVKDNGTNIIYHKDNDGIGIKNIRDRITLLNGILNINTNDGFRIFISIPKI